MKKNKTKSQLPYNFWVLIPETVLNEKGIRDCGGFKRVQDSMYVMLGSILYVLTLTGIAWNSENPGMEIFHVNSLNVSEHWQNTCCDTLVCECNQ